MPEDPSPTLSFPVTVSDELSMNAQALLYAGCGADIREIRLESRPEHHETRLWIAVATVAYGVALHVLISGLPAAEFGAVRPLRHEAQAVTLPLAA